MVSSATVDTIVARTVYDVGKSPGHEDRKQYRREARRGGPDKGRHRRGIGELRICKHPSGILVRGVRGGKPFDL